MAVPEAAVVSTGGDDSVADVTTGAADDACDAEVSMGVSVSPSRLSIAEVLVDSPASKVTSE